MKRERPCIYVQDASTKKVKVTFSVGGTILGVQIHEVAGRVARGEAQLHLEVPNMSSDKLSIVGEASTHSGRGMTKYVYPALYNGEKTALVIEVVEI